MDHWIENDEYRDDSPAWVPITPITLSFIWNVPSMSGAPQQLLMMVHREMNIMGTIKGVRSNDNGKGRGIIRRRFAQGLRALFQAIRVHRRCESSYREKWHKVAFNGPMVGSTGNRASFDWHRPCKSYCRNVSVAIGLVHHVTSISSMTVVMCPHGAGPGGTNAPRTTVCAFAPKLCCKSRSGDDISNYPILGGLVSRVSSFYDKNDLRTFSGAMNQMCWVEDNTTSVLLTTTLRQHHYRRFVTLIG